MLDGSTSTRRVRGETSFFHPRLKISKLVFSIGIGQLFSINIQIAWKYHQK